MQTPNFFEQFCPICGNSLTLGMQIVGGPIFIESENYYQEFFTAGSIRNHSKQHSIIFHNNEKIIGLKPVFRTDTKMSWQNYMGIDPENGNSIFTDPKDHEIEFKLQIIKNSIYFMSGPIHKLSAYYFYYLCQPKAIGMSLHGLSHSIDMSAACYYRSSETLINKSEQNVSTREEYFSYKILNKLYYLGLDYDKQIMNFHQLSISDGIIISRFEKSFPAPNNRFDFSNKEKIIKKFNNWTLIS